MKEYIKNHKKTIILVVLFYLLVVLVIIIARFLMPDDSIDSNKERYKDIGEYPIDEAVYKKIDEEYDKNTNVTKKTTHRVQGKTINIYVTLDDKATVADAKKLGDVVISAFDEKTLSYYSIQVWMLKENKELNNFPIVGMKHPQSEKLVWTQDREITKDDEGEANEE